MVVIPVHDDLIDETYHAVRLPRFAQRAHYAEDQFFGINNAATQQAACKPIWTHATRARLAQYLGEAQDELEEILKYPLYPKWFVNEQHYWKWPIHSDWGKVVEAGYRHAEAIATGVAVSYVTDPSVITCATTVTDEDEIRVFHPGTEIEIIPSAITIAGGTVTIQVPRARLVETASQDNPETGWTYSDVPPSVTSPFEATVDVYRVHNNADIQAGVIWPHRSSASCACDYCSDACFVCGEYNENACIYIRDYERGTLDILPATYSAGTWTSTLCTNCYCVDPQLVRINYRAGLTVLTKDLEEAIIQLALAKYPAPPCGCGVISDWWAQANQETDTAAFGMKKLGAAKALDIVSKRYLQPGFAIG